MLFFAIFLNLYSAENLNDKDLIYLFKHKYYNYICQKRWRYINMYTKKREDLLSVVAYACLKKRYITFALDLAKSMRFTKVGRNNANYIATLFNIKTILRRYLVDKIPLNGVEFPYVIDNNLGKVFNLIKKQNPQVKNNAVLLNDGNQKILVTYKIETDEIILDFLDNQRHFLRKERYW